MKTLGVGLMQTDNGHSSDGPVSGKGPMSCEMSLIPILLGLFIWGSSNRNKTILFRTDNEALVSKINCFLKELPNRNELCSLLVNWFW
jgi:hypothetical protein